MTFVLALDQGTTSSRAILFSKEGEIAAVAQREFRQHYPQPGWVEHDAREIWTSQCEVATRVIAQAGLKSADIGAIGITNQRETVVVWNRANGEPIHRAIVWQDRRTAADCDRLRASGLEAMIRQKTGLLVDPYFSGTKLAWILTNIPGARAAAERGELAFGTVDSWLLYRLTGGKVHVTDASNASRTLLMNIHTGDWDEELLDVFDIPLAMLPEIRPSSQVYGEVESIPELERIPIAGIAGDQQAALFGQACFEKGAAKNTYGTGCFMLMNTGYKAIASQNKLLTTVACKLNDSIEYALEGSVFIGGAVVAWLRDGLGIIKSSSEVEQLAGSVSDSGDVYFVPAFVGLGAPYWDPYARGAIVGLTRGTTAAHIARAAIDSIALQVADLADAMYRDADHPLAELRVDGGASVNDYLLQYQANIMQRPVVRPKVTETTALGAAYLAGLAIGLWGQRQEISRHWRVDRRFEPQMSADQASLIRARWHKAVERARNWAFEE